MKHLQSQYDLPAEAEDHMHALFWNGMRTAREVLAFSLLFALAFALLWSCVGWFCDTAWTAQHVLTDGLTAVSAGCARLYLKHDDPRQELELKW